MTDNGDLQPVNPPVNPPANLPVDPSAPPPVQNAPNDPNDSAIMRLTGSFLTRVRGTPTFSAPTRVDRAWLAIAVAVGFSIAALFFFNGNWPGVLFYGVATALFVALSALPDVQARLLGAGERLTRRHALYLLFFFGYVLLTYLAARTASQSGVAAAGKNSTLYWALGFLVAVFAWMAVRSLLAFTRFGHAALITGIPMWEQVLIAGNEVVSAALLALVGSGVWVRLTQPAIFTTEFDPAYTLGLLGAAGLFFAVMQMMWWRAANDWISRREVWVRWARLIMPFLFIVVVFIIVRRFLERADLRTATLLGEGGTTLAVLSVAPVASLILAALLYLLFTSSRGLRQRVLPDLLLDRLPVRVGNVLRTISDMDLLLVIGLVATFIPLILIVQGSSGLLTTLRQELLQQGGAIIETSEQALGLLFAAPFYLFVVFLLGLYALVISRRTLSASERERMVRSLPVGFLIIVIITLYLFAVPFSQVITEGRLPQLPQDLGRILAFNIVVPLALLYAHYFLLVRFPYSRGQNQWRAAETVRLTDSLISVEARIGQLNTQIAQIDSNWNLITGAASPQQVTLFSTEAQIGTLYRYVQLNSQRDDLNMQRLQILSERQTLSEISDAPLSVVVARLPLRVVSLGIPLLIIYQLYQWVVINNGLRDVINDPNLSVFGFFRALLRQLQF